MPKFNVRMIHQLLKISGLNLLRSHSAHWGLQDRELSVSQVGDTLRTCSDAEKFRPARGSRWWPVQQKLIVEGPQCVDRQEM